MKTFLLITILAAGLHAAEPNTRVPVLAELFTSEGCSSCPPADVLLMKLDQMQPVAGAQIIVLSEHVDYWNYLGWRDRFSSAQFTQRQEMYTRALTAESYTPQLIVDGRKEVLGSDERAIQSAVAKAVARPKLPVRIVSAKRDDNEAVVSISVGAASGKADVWVAIADDRDQSSVKNGENKGRTLNHVAVVRTLSKAGTVTKAAGLEKTVHVPLTSQEGMRVVVFVAESGGPVTGAAMQELQ
jgi:hypothetical protein